MDLQIRPIVEEEFPAFARTLEAAFGNQAGDGEVAGWQGVTEMDRTLATIEDGSIVATAGAFTLHVTVPGERTVPAAGVTAVGVRPSHRRRGLLRALMERQLDDIARGGEALAILTASESIIYGRFGYGAATSHASLAIDPRRSDFAQPREEHGRMRMVEAADARAIAPSIHDRARINQPGDISRSGAVWDLTTGDPEWARPGEQELFWAVHYSPTGDADGVVSYRVKRAWPEGLPGSEVRIDDLIGVDAEVEASLWRYVLDLDLAGLVIALSRPVDEAFRWRLADPRRLRLRHVTDHVWVRLLDVPTALAARHYAVDGEVVVDVRDPFRPATDGRYLLRGGPDGAECARTARPADVTLGVAELGTAYLGDARLSVLARAGRVLEHRDGTVGRLDRMFRSDVVPFCHTDF
jgi:predicted acetyltransferase